MGSSSCKRISLLGIADPIVGNHFQAWKVHLKVDTIDVLIGKRPGFGLVMYFVTFWMLSSYCLILGRKPNFCISKKTKVVIKLNLYD